MDRGKLLETGMSAFNNGDYPAAVNWLQKALLMLRQAGKPEELGLCICTLEGASALSEDHAFQQEPFEEALGLLQQRGLHYLAASCCTSLAEIVVAKDPEEEKHFLDAARRITTSATIGRAQRASLVSRRSLLWPEAREPKL